MLRGLPLKISYRTGLDDLVSDFFVPCLSACMIYRRATGYFTSSGLAAAARGVASLVDRGGHMRLVASPQLDAEDVTVLQQAQDDPASVLQEIVLRGFSEIEDALIHDRLRALAWLAAEKRLEVRLALRVSASGQLAGGIYHEKVGVFSDADENHVSFIGSSNETDGGLVANFESIKAFKSWKDPYGIVQEEIDYFERLWKNAVPGVRVINFSAESCKVLEKYHQRRAVVQEPAAEWQVDETPSPAFSEPVGLKLREYQKQAIRAWSKNGGKGIFAMATGSGKTKTALSLAFRVAQKNSPLAIIIIAPFLNLCRQWIDELKDFNLRAVPCFDSWRSWSTAVENAYQFLATGQRKVIALVVTNATFQGERFQNQLRAHVTGIIPHLMIADEVHNLGSGGQISNLPAEIQLRLGLSATPERAMDPEGTAAVLNYFGGSTQPDDAIVFSFSIAQAIHEGHLCKYRYYPILVSLTEDEVEEYLELTDKLKSFLSGDDNGELSKQGMYLLMKRARLLGTAQNKLVALDDLLSQLGSVKNAVFYCGDGRTTDEISDDEVRHVQAVSNLVSSKHNLRVRHFTSRESMDERLTTIKDLQSGYLDGVVAIRCLDEGIDIPGLRQAFILASSTNPRQFVQRRGRILRKAEGKEFAEIYDFMIEPPAFADPGSTLFDVERRLMQRELTRVCEFCEHSQNGTEEMHKLRRLRARYGLLSQ